MNRSWIRTINIQASTTDRDKRLVRRHSAEHLKLFIVLPISTTPTCLLGMLVKFTLVNKPRKKRVTIYRWLQSSVLEIVFSFIESSLTATVRTTLLFITVFIYKSEGFFEPFLISCRVTFYTNLGFYLIHTTLLPRTCYVESFYSNIQY